MSRSYRNFPSYAIGEYANTELWSKTRAWERNCIDKELRSYEYGDAVFPRYKQFSRGCWRDFSHHRFWASINNIRNKYYAEINHVLNHPYKKVESPLEYLEWIEWLNQRKIRNVIANWTGDPPDVLYYLARHGYVERAVRSHEKALKGFYYNYDYGGNRSGVSNPDGNRAARERIEKRKASIENRRKKKERKLKVKKEAMERLNAVKRVLQKDNAAKKWESKRPGPEKFIHLFSFMMTEERLAACQDWRARSFNMRKQYFEFIRDCVYPYPVPEALVLTSILPDYTIDYQYQTHKSPDYDTIALSQRWLRDIADGDSFYKRNREFFTRAEAHCFLSSKIGYHDPSSVFEQYFQAKCKARHFSPALSLMVSRIFGDRFSKYSNHTLITGFLDFIARNREHSFTTREMIDLSDFVVSKITRHDQPFSFSGRTLSSLITLANEWHIDRQRRMVVEKTEKCQWAGLPVSDFLHETEDALWEIKQLRTAEDLFAEEQKMKTHVTFYVNACANGSCGIFTVSCIDKSSNRKASFATVEVSCNNTILEVWAKRYQTMERRVKKIIKLWTLNNHLKGRYS